MKNKFVLLFLIFLVLAITGFVGLQLGNQTKSQTQVQEKNDNVISYQSQIDEKGEIVVEVTPVNLSSSGNVSFDIKFTTHSVDLNYDIKNISTLTDDRGNEYKALSWTDGSGGHHLEGILTFPKISEEVKSIKLTIPGIDNIDRIFEWNL